MAGTLEVGPYSKKLLQEERLTLWFLELLFNSSVFLCVEYCSNSA